MKTIVLNKGIQLHFIQSKKYKEIAIYFNYYQRITRENRVIRSLVAYLLADKTKCYPSKSELTRAKDMLFGASINATHFCIGDGSIIQVVTRVLNDDYATCGNLKNTLKLLKEILANPIIDEDSLKEAKRNLKDNALRKMDKPMSYATSRVYSLYGKDSYLELAAIMEGDQIDAISLEAVKQEFDALTNQPLDIFVFGEFDEMVIEKEFLNFNFKDATPIVHAPCLIEQKEYARVCEYKEVDQCSLIMVYETHITNGSDQYYRLKAANSLLGMVPSSLLFQEVREKNSLCYSIHSSVLSDEGLLMIKTGIDSANEDRAIDLIQNQVNRLKTGDFELQQLKDSLTLYCNLLYGSIDDVSATLSFHYASLLNHSIKGPEAMIELFNSYTKEDVMEAFKPLELKFVYSLKKQGVSDEENS